MHIRLSNDQLNRLLYEITIQETPDCSANSGLDPRPNLKVVELTDTYLNLTLTYIRDIYDFSDQ